MRAWVVGEGGPTYTDEDEQDGSSKLHTAQIEIVTDDLGEKPSYNVNHT